MVYNILQFPLHLRNNPESQVRSVLIDFYRKEKISPSQENSEKFCSMYVRHLQQGAKPAAILLYAITTVLVWKDLEVIQIGDDLLFDLKKEDLIIALLEKAEIQIV